MRERDDGEPLLGDADLGGAEPGIIRIGDGAEVDTAAQPAPLDGAPEAMADGPSDEAEREPNGEDLAPEGQDSAQARVVAYLEAHDKRETTQGNK